MIGFSEQHRILEQQREQLQHHHHQQQHQEQQHHQQRQMQQLRLHQHQQQQQQFGLSGVQMVLFHCLWFILHSKCCEFENYKLKRNRYPPAAACHLSFFVLLRIPHFTFRHLPLIYHLCYPELNCIFIMLFSHHHIHFYYLSVILGHPTQILLNQIIKVYWDSFFIPYCPTLHPLSSSNLKSNLFSNTF